MEGVAFGPNRGLGQSSSIPLDVQVANNAQHAALEELAASHQTIAELAQRMMATLPPGDVHCRSALANMVQRSQKDRAEVSDWSACATSECPQLAPEGKISHDNAQRPQNYGGQTPDRQDRDDALPGALRALRALYCLGFGLVAALLAIAICVVVMMTGDSNSIGPVRACIYVGFVALFWVMVIATMPEGPTEEMKSFTNFYLVCAAAVGWHAVALTWEQTESELPASQQVHRGLIVCLSLFTTAVAVLHGVVGRAHFWQLCRLYLALCAIIRLSAIFVLRQQLGATEFPPGALPFAAAVAAASLPLAVSCLSTLRIRRRVARAIGISQRIQQLQHQARRWLTACE